MQRCHCYLALCHRAAEAPCFQRRSRKWTVFSVRTETCCCFFVHLSTSSLSLALIIRTLQIQLCTSVNRAVAVLSWALQEEKSLECCWIKWCILIDSYLETGLMESSRQNANRLPPLRLLAHTHPQHTALWTKALVGMYNQTIYIWRLLGCMCQS